MVGIYSDSRPKPVYKFDATLAHKEIVAWIRGWFEKNGPGCNAVLGMSGGKDSTVVAALCAEALGADKVIGVAMPDNSQGINDADEICKHLGIRYMYMPIDGITSGFKTIWNRIGDEDFKWSEQSEQNIPPRVRMTMLYAISQTWNGRVANTCNLSEDYVGYATLFGDSAGSFSPFGNLTVTEILAIGDEMGLPREWVHKTPDDGLPHSSSDEQKFGFTYTELDAYIRERVIPTGFTPSGEHKIDKIDRMYKSNKFKTDILRIPSYTPSDKVMGRNQ